MKLSYEDVIEAIKGVQKDIKYEHGEETEIAFLGSLLSYLDENKGKHIHLNSENSRSDFRRGFDDGSEYTESIMNHEVLLDPVSVLQRAMVEEGIKPFSQGDLTKYTLNELPEKIMTDSKLREGYYK